MNFIEFHEDYEDLNELEENEENEENITDEVHISTALSSKKIMELIDEYPNLSMVTCPTSIYNRISKKYLEVLEELGISVKIKYYWEKPANYSENRKNIINLTKKGFCPQDIAKKLNLPVQSVYNLKYKSKNDQLNSKIAKRKKYTKEDRINITNLIKEGMKPKDIAKKLNLPIQSVYNLKYKSKNDQLNSKIAKRKKYTKEDRINVVNLIKEGMSPKDIAKKLDLPVQSVYNLKYKSKDDQLNLKIGRHSNEAREKVKKLAKDGVPVKKISNRENIPVRTIYDILNEK